jgi:hypothetical protein
MNASEIDEEQLSNFEDATVFLGLKRVVMLVCEVKVNVTF